MIRMKIMKIKQNKRIFEIIKYLNFHIEFIVLDIINGRSFLISLSDSLCCECEKVRENTESRHMLSQNYQ